ncbi:MAG: rhodanese-like domain-containing protein [Planctomycetales bacterium]|nr:rhodanese-like domain-containing protein [Planctomycetales bacterium]
MKATQDVACISPQELADRDARSNVDLIDVRTPLEYREVHALTARNVPLDQLDPQAIMTARNGHAEQPLYLICKSGSRGEKALRKFHDAGFTNVVNVSGGTEAWVDAGLPVIRGKKAVSLERQVRIAAGFLVMIGGLLSFWNVYFALVPAVVGGGLMAAGITDTCAMGMMLAKMPWNQVKSGGCCGNTCSGAAKH